MVDMVGEEVKESCAVVLTHAPVVVELYVQAAMVIDVRSSLWTSTRPHSLPTVQPTLNFQVLTDEHGLLQPSARESRSRCAFHAKAVISRERSKQRRLRA